MSPFPGRPPEPRHHPDPRSPDPALPDPVSGGPERLLDPTALDDPELRRALAEVLDAEAHAEPVPLPPAVHAAALAAWRAHEALGSPPRAVPEPPAPRIDRREAPVAAAVRSTPARRRLALAASVVLLLGAGWIFLSGSEARAGLRLDALERIDAGAGRVESTRDARLAAGTRVRSAAGTETVLRLEGGGTVLLGPSDGLRVERGGSSLRLVLEGPHAWLSAGSVPLEVRVAGAGDLLLERGEAGVGIAGPDGRRAAVRLSARAEATFLPDVGPEVRWAGAGDRAIGGDVPAGGETPEPPGLAPLSRVTLGGGPPGELAWVSARRWRVTEGRAHRHGASLRPSRGPGRPGPRGWHGVPRVSSWTRRP